LDTGADVFVAADRHWAKSWPCQPSAGNLQGLGDTNGPLQNAQQIHWSDEEGHSEIFASYVLDNILVNLWGTDVLERVWELYSEVLIAPNVSIRQ
jgi:hypothetical protein